MRKIICLALAVSIVLPCAAAVGCTEEGERSQYTITAEYEAQSRTLAATMRFDWYNNTGNALRELCFELYPNAYREGAKYPAVSELYAPSAYYAGDSYGGIEIGTVTGAESYSVAGEDENILRIKLPEEVYPDERATLELSFVTALAQVEHRLGVGEHAVNLSSFYPVLCAYNGGFCEYVYASCGDPFVSECADYEVTLTLPEDYVLSCGRAIKTVAENGKNTYHIVSENVRDLAFVCGKDMKCIRTQSCGVDVEYYYFGDTEPQTGLRAAAESLAFYSRTFGEYAYPIYTVVETELCAGGMEYPMLSMISSDLREEEIPLVVAHETAHQWWYAMVGNNQFEHAWMDEGLSDYSATLFLEAYPSYGYSRAELVSGAESSYRAFFSVRSQLYGEADTGMSRLLTDFSGEYEYGNVAYHKSMILFDRLRMSVGDRAFYSGLKTYAEKYRFRIASPEDMISCFARAEGLFDSFINGKCVI